MHPNRLLRGKLILLGSLAVVAGSLQITETLADDCSCYPGGCFVQCDVNTGVCTDNENYCDSVPPTDGPVPPGDGPDGCDSSGGSGAEASVESGTGGGLQIHPNAGSRCGCDDGGGSPGGAPIWLENPVHMGSGRKAETAIDLRIPLPGRDFILSRSYTSTYDPSHTSGLTHGHFGKNWQLNAMFRVERAYNVGTSWTDDASLRVVSLKSGASYFNWSAGDSRWNPVGPTTQWIESGTLQVDIGEGSGKTYPVYTLIDPGNWKMHFGRLASGGGIETITANSYKDGALFRIDDWHGNTKTYKYTNLGGGGRWRLTTIDCAPAGGDVEDGARIEFDYDSTSLPRLEEVIAKRHNGTAWVEVSKVAYTFRTGETPDYLGSAGDLIQVIQSTKLDVGDQWYTRVTQYRYHSGSTESSDSDSDGFVESGFVHQLKAVFLPEQIEYAAEQFNANSYNLSNKKTLEQFAAMLLLRADGAPYDTHDGSGSATKVMSMAAKVIAKYDPNQFLPPPNQTTPNPAYTKVKEQWLQSSCGCSGASAQGIRIEYDYGVTYTWSTSGDWSHTLKVSEFEGTSSTARRTRYLDLRKYAISITNHTPTEYVYRLGIDALREVVASASNEWVTRYTYDGTTTRRLDEVFTPSAHTDYVPGTGGTTYPTWTMASNGTGLVHKYSYSTANRVTEEAVHAVGSSAIPVRQYEYLTASGKTHLVSAIDSWRVASPSGGNDKERMEFSYFFHAGSTISWIETATEAELESENGPSGSSVKYYSHEYFDAQGNNTWSRAEDGRLTQRTFSDRHGKVTSIIENAPGDDLEAEEILPEEGINGDFSGRDGDGGSLTTDYVYDDLGRMRSVEGPGGATTRYVRQLARVDTGGLTTGMLAPVERMGFASSAIPYLAIVTLPHTFGSTEFDGPATVTLQTAEGKAFQRTTHSLASNSSSTYGSIFTTPAEYDFVLSSTKLAQSTTQHRLTGLVQSTKQWHSIAGNGEGSGIYTTSYTYDTLGRVDTVTAANGTITEYEYDVLDRVIEAKVGAGGTPNMATVSVTIYDGGSGTTPGVGNGNVTLTRQQMDDTPTHRDTKYTYDYRDRLVRIESPEKPNTLMIYDNLDRMVEQAVFKDLPSVTDDLTGSDNDRGQYTKTFFSQRGTVYKTQTAIDPTLASGSRTYLETHTWFDESGRAVGVWSPNAPGSKTTYDGLGRTKVAYTTDRRGDDAPGASGNYADVFASHAAVVTGDVVIQQVNYRYISSQGLMDLVTTYQRGHRGITAGTPLITDSDTGALDALSATKRITTFMAYFYDDADRATHTADYGTNRDNGTSGDNTDDFISGGTAPTDTSPPSSGTSVLVTQTIYNVRGLVDQNIDPEGHKTKYEYDDMNRRIAVIENYVDAVIAWSTTPDPDRWAVSSGLSTSELDKDRVTSFVYDGAGNIVVQTAHIPASGSDPTAQVTQYIYGVTKGTGTTDSDIQTNDLLLKVHYPDETTGVPSTSADYTVTYGYNRQGELKYMKDQNTTEHTYTRDNIGRVKVDKASTGESTLDATIDAIRTLYDDFGRVEYVKSHDGYSNEGSLGTVKNAVKFTYTKLWQIQDVWQEPFGDVVTSGSPQSLMITHNYANTASSGGSGNSTRLATLVYPDVSYVYHVFGADADDSDDRISRLTALNLETHNIYYDYIGMDMTAIVDFDTPDIQLDRTAKHLGYRNTNSPNLEYPGYDRFARVVRHMWVDGNFTTEGNPVTNSNRPPIVELTHTYDKASNRLTTYNQNIVLADWATRDSVFGYDGLDRLQQADRGKSGGSFTYAPNNANYTPSLAWKTSTAGEMLDMLGNWKVLITDKDGNGPAAGGTDTKESRIHNQANELLSQDLDSAGAPILDFTDGGTVDAYDKAGNMRRQKVGSESAPTLITYTHDLWNRLVKVEYTPNGGSKSTRAKHVYNGLNWRILKQADTNASGEADDAGLDQQRIMYYSANWQLLQEFIDDDGTSFPDALGELASGGDVDRRMQYMWGPRYIDDILLRRLDANADGDYDDSGTDKVYFHCTDAMFSTVEVLDATAKTLERVSYDPYGMARHHRMGDVAVGTGTTDSADYMLALANYGSVPARGDANRDGDVNVNDVLAIIGDINAGPALGKLSITDNQIGWDGYVFNAEADPDGMYTVRHRHYKPTLGRWIERDPLTFDEAMNLFQFAKSNSVIYLDDTGAQTTQPAPTPNYQDPKRWNTSPCKRDRRREGRQYIPENDACVAVCDALARDNAKELEDSNKESEGRPRKIGGHTYGISYCDKKDKDGNPIRGTCCVCRKNYQPTGASPEAVELSFLCTLTHEETHNMQSCTGDSNCREAEAYEEERKCLEASKASCRDSGRFPKVADQSRCERHVSERIKNVEKQRDKFKALCSCKD